jgi:hypothetical protein
VRTRSKDNELVPIAAADLTRFRKNAPAALARRGGGFVAESVGNALALLLAGLIPIVGLVWFGWSASEMLVFLVIGLWIGILGDFAKFALLPGQVRRSGAAYYEDWQVWVVASALRRGKNEAPRSHLEAKYTPVAALFVDLVFGGVATAILCIALAKSGFDIRQELWNNAWLVKSIAALAIYEAAFTLWEVVRHKLGGEAAGQVRVTLGMRGLGLFLLMFLVVMLDDALHDNGATARVAMLVVNAAILALAAFNLVGLYWVRTETAWLREYLQGLDSSADNRSRREN